MREMIADVDAFMLATGLSATESIDQDCHESPNNPLTYDPSLTYLHRPAHRVLTPSQLSTAGRTSR
jgi:hypothetical protein